MGMPREVSQYTDYQHAVQQVVAKAGDVVLFRTRIVANCFAPRAVSAVD